MSDPFTAEIRMAGFNFAPSGWALCDGQVMPIMQNTALFSLIGNFYGGDLTMNTFALPDLRGRTPIHQGQGSGLTQRAIGSSGGQSGVTLTEAQLPTHFHQAKANSGIGSLQSPANNVWAAEGRGRPLAYSSNGPNVMMSNQALAQAGSSTPHNNMAPFLAVLFIICLQGVFPSP